jgi:hypothetical protein
MAYSSKAEELRFILPMDNRIASSGVEARAGMNIKSLGHLPFLSQQPALIVPQAGLNYQDRLLASCLLNPNAQGTGMLTQSAQSRVGVMNNTPNHLLQRAHASLLGEVLLSEAIAKEKALLRQNLFLGQTAVPVPSITANAPILQQPASRRAVVHHHHHQQQQQPINPQTIHVLDAIGSEIRNGHPFIDVSRLPGIDPIKSEPHRMNRGGVIETFPEVRLLHCLGNITMQCATF